MSICIINDHPEGFNCTPTKTAVYLDNQTFTPQRIEEVTPLGSLTSIVTLELNWQELRMFSVYYMYQEFYFRFNILRSLFRRKKTIVKELHQLGYSFSLINYLYNKQIVRIYPNRNKYFSFYLNGKKVDKCYIQTVVDVSPQRETLFIIKGEKSWR